MFIHKNGEGAEIHITPQEKARVEHSKGVELLNDFIQESLEIPGPKLLAVDGRGVVLVTKSYKPNILDSFIRRLM